MEERRCSSGWSDLSQPLLELILKLLTPLDHLRFGSVCRSWRIAQRGYPAQDLPFHIVSRDLDYIHIPRESIELYSFSEKKIYKKSLHRRFLFAYSIPYSRGWLLLYDPDQDEEFLLNPFITDGCIDVPKQGRRTNYFECLFFISPTYPDGVFLYRAGKNKFLPCRLNPRSDHQYYEWQKPIIVSEWDVDPLPHRYYDWHWQKPLVPLLSVEDYVKAWDQETCRTISSFIFFQGKLYALNEHGGLSVVNTLFPHDSSILKMKLENTDSALSVECHDGPVLLESWGEMLLVLRMRVSWNSSNVAVFRANLTELEWVNVKNLGDRALLIFDQRSSVSVCTIDSTDFRSNCVYCFSFQEEDSVPYEEFELGEDGCRRGSIPLFDGVIDDES
ncbi:hypothetical protein MRB53_000166 [Persea americana]|uniref:Uncharacterized protein n=1 Tax=Persea americana TaxID=3435 RepID=A0ACC2MP44_PERAE|nr:hypothetical protein MRB53_000166 [Persea americana]